MRPRNFVDPALPDIAIDAVIVFTPRHASVACSYAELNSGYGVPAPTGSVGGLGAQADRRQTANAQLPTPNGQRPVRKNLKLGSWALEVES
jgi:hypothetical protein